MKKILIFVILSLLSMLFLLTGCGDKPNDPPDGGVTYTVTFVVDDKTSTVTVGAGEVPKNKTKAPSGYTIAGWDKEIVAATADATYTAILNSGDNVSDELLMEAYRYSLITKSAPGVHWLYPGYFDATTAFFTMVMEEHENLMDGPLADRIVEQVKWCVKGGTEEICDACCYWPYNIYTAAMALVKDTPTVWDKLSQDDIDRLDLLMRAYACMESFATADYNDYLCGPGRSGNYNKGWNANYRLANIPTMLWCCCYLGGAEATNQVLCDFDYDTYMQAFDDYGFVNIYDTWMHSHPDNNDGKNVMMNGGALTLFADGESTATSAGTGVGVRPARYKDIDYTEYTYAGMTLDDWTGIFENQVAYCFSGGTVSNLACNNRCYILRGGDENPVRGLQGMMIEFEGSDAGGAGRSSTVYCSHDLIMIVVMLRAAKALNMWDADEHTDLMELVKNGMDDEIYKSIMGYHCVSNGSYYDEHEQTEGGYFFAKDMWQKNYSDRTVEFGDWTQYKDLPADPPEEADTQAGKTD